MWIAVFKTGEHTDSQGRTQTWTEKDLDTIASKYDPAAHEAPVVIGHPKENAPAYGWVEGLKREGDILMAKIKPTVEEFKGWLKQGLFKKRSISLYPDMSLRHIGFLGATPPAVKGLPDFAFGEAQAAVIEFEEFSDNKKIHNAKEVRKIAGLAAAKKHGVEVDKTKFEFVGARCNVPFGGRGHRAPTPERRTDMSFLQRLKAFITQEEVGATGATAPSNKNFADGGAPVIGPACNGCTLCEEICPVNAIDGEPGKQHVIDPDACNGCGVCMDRCAFGAITMPGTGANAGAGAVSASMSERRGMSHVPGKENMGTDFAEKEKDLKAREEKLLELEGKARKKQISDFVESLKGKGIIVPAMEKLGMGISSFLEAIAGLDTTYEFAELSPSPSGRGEGVREKHTPLAFMQAFLSGLPKVVTFSEVATAAGDPGPSATGEGTSPLLEKLVKEFQEKNPKATLQTAYIEVAREHPELFEDDYRKMVKA